MKNTKLNKNVLSLVLTAPLLALAPACGDSDGTTTTGGTTAPTTTASSPATTTGGQPTGTGTNPGTGGTGGDTTGTGTGTAPAPSCANPTDPNAPVMAVSADLNGNTEWTCDKIYILEQNAKVTVRGGTLKIQAGTTIKGKGGSALIIEKDAKLEAVGTADKPIVFTSHKPTAKTRGDWGGLVFLGQGITNQGVNVPAEGFSTPRTFGGTNAAHNCGTLQYVRVEWAGFALTTDNELNGITFYACGTETKVDHVQSHMGLDDGIEWFGGGFNASHLIVTGAKDDSLDVDLGFNGNLQFIFVHQDPTVGDNGFEVSGNSTKVDATPLTKPGIANLTFVGSGATGDKSRGFTFKQGTGYNIYNSIAVNSKNEAFQFQSPQTKDMMVAGTANITGSILNTAAPATALVKTDADFGLDAAAVETWIGDANRGNSVRGDAALPSAAWGTPNIKPAVGGLPSTAAKAIPAAPGLVNTNYVGAVDPAAPADWTKAAWVNYAVQ